MIVRYINHKINKMTCNKMNNKNKNNMTFIIQMFNKIH